MIWIYDFLKKQNTESSQIGTLWKFYSNLEMTNTKQYIGKIICIFNNKLQKVSFKNSFIWKSVKDF
jgi:hypothetical protein